MNLQRFFSGLALVFLFIPLHGQNFLNIKVTAAETEQVILGNYDPLAYQQSNPVADLDMIICDMQDGISADSLHSYIDKLETFYNRNTYSDTVSNTTGIGAARRWVLGLFQQFSAANEDRLLPAYLQFDLDGAVNCQAGRFKNILGVLPGADTSDKSILIIEGHMDSRCEDRCDITCFASGADDNSSGTALVIELARVMSQYTFDHTIVFMVTVGEEQGLLGATAMAMYAVDSNIAIKAVQNNDVVGGVLCGMTSSPPSCSPVDAIDSTQVRIFSYGANASPHKNYARFIKMIYEEKVMPEADVAMNISIMTSEDRGGRGGDHIPFRQNGFTAVRFSSAHEHGNGNPATVGYMDHQHTSGDSLGVDFNNDGIIDSFFVDFNYLKRNAIINAAALTAAASGPDAPEFTLDNSASQVRLTITNGTQHQHYRVGVRTNQTDFDAMYTMKDTLLLDIPGLVQGNNYKISVAAVDNRGYASLFSAEQQFTSNATTTGFSADTVEYFPVSCKSTSINDVWRDSPMDYQLLQNRPNPFSERTFITIVSGKYGEAAKLVVRDINGKEVWEESFRITGHSTTVEVEGSTLKPGLYLYSLEVKGSAVATRKMIHY